MFNLVNIGTPLREVKGEDKRNLDGSGECVAVAVSQLLEHSTAPEYKGMYLVDLIIIFFYVYLT